MRRLGSPLGGVGGGGVAATTSFICKKILIFDSVILFGAAFRVCLGSPLGGVGGGGVAAATSGGDDELVKKN